MKKAMLPALWGRLPGGETAWLDPHARAVTLAAWGFACNLAYALFHGVLGLVSGSLWFVTLAAYYALLSVTRFSVVRYARRALPHSPRQAHARRMTGLLLVALSAVLASSVWMSFQTAVTFRHHPIAMIALAAYAFTKLTLAIVNAAKARRRRSPLLSAIRGISCADAAASILSLQRSMLATFEGMSPEMIRVMNAATGGAVFLIVCLLGLSMALRPIPQET